MEVARLGNSSLREEHVLKLWDDYILDNIVESAPCQIGIYDIRSQRKIVSSDGFWVKPKELEQVIDGVTYPDPVCRNGLTLNGKTYKVRVADGKYGIYARTEDRACSICKTLTLIIIGLNDNDIPDEKFNEHIMKFGDYLRRAEL